MTTDGNSNNPERRVQMAERLIRVETQLEHLTDNTEKLINSFDNSTLDNRRVHQTVVELISSVHNQSSSLLELKTSMSGLRTEVLAKASLEKVHDLEERINEHSKIIDRAAAILRAIEWTLKIGGPATVAGALYWIFTGDVPGSQ